ncbi:hypothetical protein K413DRAFT_4352 [Clostridium sp. ASBs410]|nr:hypothetical protein K413DRAFT_4352 [Clostridium sp. ASBs410]
MRIEETTYISNNGKKVFLRSPVISDLIKNVLPEHFHPFLYY